MWAGGISNRFRLSGEGARQPQGAHPDRRSHGATSPLTREPNGKPALNYYPFHLGDYLAHTAHLDPIEDIAYRRMLDLYYMREGPLPHDVGEIARLIRMRDAADRVQSVLREFFEDAEDGYRHKRCDEEILRMQERQAKARASAEASVSARQAKAKRTLSERSTNAQRMLNERSTDAELPTPTPTPTPDIPPIPPKGPELFEEFWAAFPRKVGKDAAARAFAKRKPDRSMLDQMLAAIATQKGSPQWVKDGGEFIPHPSTWLNQGRWQDEVRSTLRVISPLYPDGNAPSGYVPFGMGG